MPQITLSTLALLALLVGGAPPATGQRPCQQDRNEDTPARMDTVPCRDAELPSPDANAPVRGVVPAGFVTADKNDSEVQIQAGKRLRPSRTWGQLSVNAGATAPLSDGPLSPLAELRGALPGTALELSLSGVRWPTLPVGTSRDALDWCRRTLPAGEPCTQRQIETKHPELVGRYLRVTGFRRPVVYNVSVRAAYDQHDFVDDTDLEARSQRRVPVTLSSTFGGFLGATLLTVNGRWERRYDDGDEVDICSPVGLGSAERCRTARLGEPQSASRTVFTIQARRFLSGSAAVNVRAVYRVNDDAWSVEAPIYFIPSATGTLIGGIVPGWSSGGREFTVRLFVGQAFGLRAM